MIFQAAVVDLKTQFLLNPGRAVFGEFGTFGDLITVITRFLFGAAFLVAFIMILVGGIRWIGAGSDEKAISDARNTITFAIIGLAIVFLSFFFIKLIEALTKITIL